MNNEITNAVNQGRRFLSSIPIKAQAEHFAAIEEWKKRNPNASVEEEERFAEAHTIVILEKYKDEIINNYAQIERPQQADYLMQAAMPTQEEFNTLFQDATGETKCVMSVVNNAAYVALMDAIDHLRDDGLLKGKVKQLCNQAMKAHEMHETNLKWGSHECDIDFFCPNDNIKDHVSRQDVWDWYLDIGACSYKRNAPHARFLQLAIFQEFTKKQLPHREALSYVCLAKVLLEYSCCIFDQLMRELKERDGLDYKRVFYPFRMTAVYKSFESVANLLGNTYRITDDVIDLNTVESIRTAFRAYENAIMLDFQTQESANEAIESNKHLMSKAKYREYRLDYDQARADYIKRTRGVEV